MKFLKPLVHFCFLALPASSYAMSVKHCDKPVAGSDYRQDAAYGFVYKVSCTLSAKASKTQGLVDYYQEQLSQISRYSNLSATSPAQEANLQGVSLTAHESMQTSHGDLDMEVKLKLLSNSNDHFVFASETSEISGTGNAALTKVRKVRVELQGDKVVTTLDALVEKPWGVMEFLFSGPASHGVRDQAADLAAEHAAYIAQGLSKA